MAWPEHPSISSGRFAGNEPRGSGIIAFLEGNDAEPLVCIVEKGRKNRGFPKGGRKAGETIIEAAQREWEEETGIAKCALDILPGVHVDEDKIGVRYLLATCSGTAFDATTKDGSKVQLQNERDGILSSWVPPEDPTDKDPILWAHWVKLEYALRPNFNLSRDRRTFLSTALEKYRRAGTDGNASVVSGSGGGVDGGSGGDGGSGSGGGDGGSRSGGGSGRGRWRHAGRPEEEASRYGKSDGNLQVLHGNGGAPSLRRTHSGGGPYDLTTGTSSGYIDGGVGGGGVAGGNHSGFGGHRPSNGVYTDYGGCRHSSSGYGHGGKGAAYGACSGHPDYSSYPGYPGHPGPSGYPNPSGYSGCPGNPGYAPSYTPGYTPGYTARMSSSEGFAKALAGAVLSQRNSSSQLGGVRRW
eukprot:TRINITY_DN28985_c0_g1_i1.p1 TRINITY_DN28985_c0_g1~~TRINITY_DN28985_c0_g1_i1.p1  ORF type:complete len:422 (-),score=85.80 TRINITY_DN28985_c0_g1_i1:34-1266(-)